MVFHVGFLVSLESSYEYRHTDLVWDCLELRCISYWLLNHFLNEIFKKLKLKIVLEFWGLSWCCWKALSESDLIEFISQFSELRCERYWFVSGFCCWKFKKIAKIESGKKDQLSPQCVHTWVNGIGYILVFIMFRRNY